MACLESQLKILKGFIHITIKKGDEAVSVDVKLLKDKIKKSGMTTTFVCKKSGIIRQTLYQRYAKPNHFTIDEIDGLKKTLQLTEDDVTDIFFAEYDN